jgi:hypothetical protein
VQKPQGKKAKRKEMTGSIALLQREESLEVDGHELGKRMGKENSSGLT